MTRRSWIGFGVGAALGMLMTLSVAKAFDRPPQFVVLAFDGSKSISMWESTRAFAKKMRAEGAPDFAFTYFLSGVYFLEGRYRQEYHAPHHSAGASAIGFGSTDSDLLARVAEVNAARKEGHELGSHANGHFDGSDWSEADWDSEFHQFSHLVFDTYAINRLNPGTRDPFGIDVEPKQFVGFRAPLLGVSSGLWPALRSANFRYDTSRVDAMDYWPKRDAYGTWNFPLASLRIAGSGKRTLSMDYNFFVAQTGAKEDPANAALYERQMLETYMDYFEHNYNGNRAPLNIGHHFSRWNGGAYWNAMQAFAEKVCSLPEVRCVTYSELADFMDQQKAGAILAYEREDFPKGLAIEMPRTLPRGEAFGFIEEPEDDRALLGDLPEAHLDE